MNILVINGSPKGKDSNSLKLTHAFLEGSGWGKVNIIHCSEKDIKPCLGCFACWNKTPGKCVISDDMSPILKEIISADTIIWSFPLYYFSVPGILKNFIDRHLPLSLPFMSDEESGGHPSRYDLSHQSHILISTCGFWTAKGNYDSVISMFERICGPDKYSFIACGQGELFRIPELRNTTDNYLEIVKKAGEEYTSSGISEETRIDLTKPLFPRTVFENMADASWNIDQSGNSPADESLSFTRQMASLYKSDGINRVLEFHYTDINKSYQILLEEEGASVIEDNFQPYTSKIVTPFALWQAIGRGQVSGEEALFKKQYQVLGDFNIMLKWDELFGSYLSNKKASTKKDNKTNMGILLAPWMVIWILISINPSIGSVVGILSVTFTPLLWIYYKATIYERISLPIIASLSLSVLLGAEPSIIITTSYAAFGLLWIIGSFTKIPLTAYYSSGNYGAEKAFSNPLFIHTNRILTAAWGVVYLSSSIWTYFIMLSSFSQYIGLINSIVPAFLGIFTLWFQKWYPARRAKG